MPRLSGEEKEPPRQGEPANAVRAPRLSGAEKEPPRQGEPANAVRAPRLSGAEKGAAPSGRTRLRQFECPAQSVQKRSRPVGANPLTQFAHPAGLVQKIREIPKKFSLPKRQKNAHSHAEKTPIRMTKLAKPNRAESGRKFLSKKCLTYRLGYANLYTWLAEAY